MADDELPGYVFLIITAVLGILLMIFLNKLDFNFIAGNIRFEGGAAPLPVMDIIRPAKHMVDVWNPFILNLDDGHVPSIKDGVYCQMSSLVKFTVQCYWSVEIENFYHQLRLEANQFQELVESAELFEDSSMVSGNYNKCDGANVHYKLPETDISMYTESLGTLPRTRYPLVIVQYAEIEDLEADENFCQDDPHVIAMVTIFHVQDEICKAKSHIVAQFLKMSSGQVVTLKQLHVVSNNTESNRTLTSTGPGLCIVCQTSEVTRVNLPCRHACTCSDCFRKVDFCPMCRGHIESYFSMEDSSYGPDGEMSQDATWWARWNNKLNRFFRFR